MPGSTRSSTPRRAVPGARAARATFVRGRRGRVVGVSFGALGRGACVVLCSVWFRRAALLVVILQFQHSTFFYLLYESAAENDFAEPRILGYGEKKISKLRD